MGPGWGLRLASGAVSAAIFAHVRPAEGRPARGFVRPIGAAALSAALAGLAFAPFPGAWLVAWIAWVPLFAAAARSGPLGGAAVGMLHGIGFGFASAWWLPAMLEQYFGLSRLGSYGAAIASFAAFSGAFYAAFGAALGAFARRGAVAPVFAACGFVACEWARASFPPVENAWGLAAYTQVDVRALAQLADLAGPWGIGLLLAYANALGAALFAPALRPRRPLRSAAALAAALAAAFAYGTVQLGRDFANGPPVRVAIVQGAVARPDRDPGRDAARSRAELETYLALTAQAVAAAKPALVVWPEGALDFSPFELTQRSLRLRDESRRLPVDLVIGAPRRDDAGGRRNAMIHFRHGTVLGVYDKVELTPFAERKALGLGRDALSAGEDIRLLDAAGLRIGSAICSEGMGPGYARRLVAAGATILAIPSNDYWFTSPEAARQQLAKSRFRAIETRRPVVRATSTGYSAIVDPKGDVVSESKFGAAEWIAGDVRAGTAATVSSQAGAVFGPLLLLAFASAPFLRRNRHQGELR
jgi:apolipoprotein N-acyltransferase